MKGYGGVEVYLHALLTTALGEVSCQLYDKAALCRNPLNKMLSEPQRRSGSYGEGINHFTLPGIDIWLLGRRDVV
jgi:hypothetical protein